eukprot:gene18661-25178_t
MASSRWDWDSRPRSPPDMGPPAKVLPYLHLGGACNERDAQQLKGSGITHILQIGIELKPTHPSDFLYHHVAIDDNESEDIILTLPTCFKFIEACRDSNGVLLVHCMAGVSRSAAVVLAWRMQEEALSMQEALKQLKALRPFVYPNLGFKFQLEEWQSQGRIFENWRPWSQQRFEEALGEQCARS